MTEVTLIDAGYGNVRSVYRALERAGARVIVTDRASIVARSNLIVLPGQGRFDQAMASLHAFGLDDAIREAHDDCARLLGICLGMQLLYQESSEGGRHAGLGLLAGRVTVLKSLHVGWSRVDGLEDYAYFCHQFAVVNMESMSAATQWTAQHDGQTFVAAIETESILASQFHPEKSQSLGDAWLRKWLTK